MNWGGRNDKKKGERGRRERERNRTVRMRMDVRCAWLGIYGEVPSLFAQ